MPLLLQGGWLDVAAGRKVETALHVVRGGCVHFEFELENTGDEIGLTLWVLLRRDVTSAGTQREADVELKQVRWEGMRALGVRKARNNQRHAASHALGIVDTGREGCCCVFRLHSN